MIPAAGFAARQTNSPVPRLRRALAGHRDGENFCRQRRQHSTNFRANPCPARTPKMSNRPDSTAKSFAKRLAQSASRPPDCARHRAEFFARRLFQPVATVPASSLSPVRSRIVICGDRNLLLQNPDHRQRERGIYVFDGRPISGSSASLNGRKSEGSANLCQRRVFLPHAFFR